MEKKQKSKDEKEETPYENESVEDMMENDEIKPEEAGFMEGYNEKQKIKPKEFEDILEEKDN